MTNLKTKLTTEEAFEAIQRYFRRFRIQDILAEHQVDPRRLYEILDGEDHHDARAEFKEHCRVTDPELYDYLRKTVRWRRDRKSSGGGDTPLFDTA